MGASEIREFWKREVLTAREFLDLWLEEIPGDDPYAVLEMLAHLAENDYRCIPIPWYHPVFELFNPDQGKKREEAQSRAVTTLRSMVADRGGIERAETVKLMRDGLVEAFKARKSEGPRFLHPPSFGDQLRKAIASGELAAAAAPQEKESDYGHSEDFSMVWWYGARYSFAPNQAFVVQLLWREFENHGLGLTQRTIGAALEDRDRKERSGDFRLRDVFKTSPGSAGIHPAWGTMIQRVSKGTYALRPPGNGRPKLEEIR